MYAVVVPEATLFVIGLLAFRWGRRLLIGVVAGLFLLEMYATHWLLIPYYTGLIDHAPNGALARITTPPTKTLVQVGHTIVPWFVRVFAKWFKGGSGVA